MEVPLHDVTEAMPKTYRTSRGNKKLIYLETASRLGVYVIFTSLLLVFAFSLAMAAVTDSISVRDTSINGSRCEEDSEHCTQVHGNSTIWRHTFALDRPERSTFSLTAFVRREHQHVGERLEWEFDAEVHVKSFASEKNDSLQITRMAGNVVCEVDRIQCTTVPLIRPVTSFLFLSRDRNYTITIRMPFNHSLVQHARVRYLLSTPSGNFTNHALLIAGSLSILCTLLLAWLAYVNAKHAKGTQWLPERKWVLLNLASLIPYNNPLNIWLSMEANPTVTIIRDATTQLGGISSLLLSILLYSGLRRNDLHPGWKFYRPKVLTGLAALLYDVGLLTVINTIPISNSEISELSWSMLWRLCFLLQRVYLCIWIVWEWDQTMTVLSVLPYLPVRYHHLSGQFLRSLAVCLSGYFLLVNLVGSSEQQYASIPKDLEQDVSVGIILCVVYGHPDSGEITHGNEGDQSELQEALMSEHRKSGSASLRDTLPPVGYVDMGLAARLFHLSSEAYKTTQQLVGDNAGASASASASVVETSQSSKADENTILSAGLAVGERILETENEETIEFGYDTAPERQQRLSEEFQFLFSTSRTIDMAGCGFELLTVIHIPKFDVQCLVCRGMGYFALSFRGTQSQINVKTDLQIFLSKWTEEDWDTSRFGMMGGMMSMALPLKVHYGFLVAYRCIRKELFRAIKEHSRESDVIVATGHSLGGALATLAAFDFATTLNNRETHLYTFGSPRVGNISFANVFERLVPTAYRFVFDGDIITGGPRPFYKHVGSPVIIDGLGNLQVNPTFVETVFMTATRTSLSRHKRKAYRAGLCAILGFANDNLPDLTPELPGEPSEYLERKDGCATALFLPRTYVTSVSAGATLCVVASMLSANSHVVYPDVFSPMAPHTDMLSVLAMVAILCGSLLIIVGFVWWWKDMRARKVRLNRRLQNGKVLAGFRDAAT